MMTRNEKRFQRLSHLIGYFNKGECEYYHSITNGGLYPELITESVLYEMEVTLQDLTMETKSCELI